MGWVFFFVLGLFLSPQPDSCVLDVALDKQPEKRGPLFLRNKHLFDGECSDFRVPSAIINNLLSRFFLHNSSY